MINNNYEHVYTLHTNSHHMFYNAILRNRHPFNSHYPLDLYVVSSPVSIYMPVGLGHGGN